MYVLFCTISCRSFSTKEPLNIGTFVNVVGHIVQKLRINVLGATYKSTMWYMNVLDMNVLDIICIQGGVDS